MMRINLNCALWIVLLVIHSCIANAETFVSLSADRYEIIKGEGITFHLVVIPDGRVGGIFVIQREIEPKRYQIVKTFLSYPSCPVCGGGRPLSEKLDRNFTFIPRYEGNYIAIASFGDSEATLNFTVLPIITSTSSTTSTTSTSTTSTSTTSTSTTSTSTTSTSTTSTSSSTT
ncbi:MAG: hypothetical protein DRO94_05195, partial [Candidatus Altiarchaeales archaeon]